MDSSSARSCNAMEKEIVNLIVRVFKNCPFHRCFPPLYSKWTNGESQVLRSILDGMTEGNLGDDWPVDDEGTTYYVPKNMAGVAARFARDMYWNEVPVTVTDGELTIVDATRIQRVIAGLCDFEGHTYEEYELPLNKN